MALTSLIEKIKLYALNVGLKRLGPSAFASVVATLFGLLAAHQGLLESWGITWGTWPLHWDAASQPSGQVILIELDTLGKMGIAALTVLISALGTATAHHTAQVLGPDIPPSLQVK